MNSLVRVLFETSIYTVLVPYYVKLSIISFTMTHARLAIAKPQIAFIIISFPLLLSHAISPNMMWYAPMMIKIILIVPASHIKKLIAPLISPGISLISKYPFLSLS
jgi:hypothetical protein